jgi:transcription elongation GreA/GreB family factor
VDEADPAQGLISFRSPLAAAILGAKAGDMIEANEPLGEIDVVKVEN